MEYYTKGFVVDFLKYLSEIFHWNIFEWFRKCSIDTCVKGSWTETGICMEYYTKGFAVDFLKYLSEIFHWNIFGRLRECSIDTCM